MKNTIKFCLLLLIFLGCEKKEPCLIAETGPVSFSFEVVDKQTGENLFTTGVYSQNQISIKNQNGETVEYDFIEENDINVIRVLLGWETKNDIYSVQIGNDIEFEIVFKLERTFGECYSTTKLTELKIEGIEYETLENGGVQILVP